MEPLQVKSSAHARRKFIKSGLAYTAALGSTGMAVSSANAEWSPSLRYPDPAIEVLDPAFTKYRIFNASIERLATGFRWLEGPVWVGDGGYLLVSDIANNQIIRWDEATGKASVFRKPANYPNGNTRDRHGRLLTCEGAVTRRISRTEYSGRIITLTDTYEGKPYNSPNDIVCKRDGTIWFTDPPFQLGNDYEGRIAKQALPHAVYRLDGKTGVVQRVIDDLAGPNGLCFSPDEKKLYVVEGRAKPSRILWVYTVGADNTLSGKTKFLDVDGPGALDGIKCDKDGNIWAGWGSSGAPGVDSAALDGVMIFNASGKAIGHIHLPERCANLCFGGADNNRLFMASSHSIYAVFVNTRGAVEVDTMPDENLQTD